MGYMDDIPDHPVIRNMELTGYPDGKEPEYPHCPVCGEECSEIYRNDLEIVGCDECIDTRSLDEADPPDCPECGEETDTVYVRDGIVIGCDRCVTRKDAWETEDCFPCKDMI